MLFQFQAVADANRQKAVLEIKIREKLLEVGGQKNVSLINNEILQVHFLFLIKSSHFELMYDC